MRVTCFIEVESSSDHVYLFKLCMKFDVTNGIHNSFEPLTQPDEVRQQESGFKAILKPTSIQVSANDSYLNKCRVTYGAVQYVHCSVILLHTAREHT